MTTSLAAGLKSTRRRSVSELPVEAGRPRVQRIIEELVPVHLEADVPVCDSWSVSVDGLVDSPIEVGLDDIARLKRVERVIDLHCVWGWSCPDIVWHGVALDSLFELAGVKPSTRYVTFAALNSPYAACIQIDDARSGLIALQRDGHELEPIHGGPVRFVPPAWLWGYKGVKWLGRITFHADLEPGFWEEKVGDVEGRVPQGLLTLFEQRRGWPRCS